MMFQSLIKIFLEDELHYVRSKGYKGLPSWVYQDFMELKNNFYYTF